MTKEHSSRAPVRSKPASFKPARRHAQRLREGPAAWELDLLTAMSRDAEEYHG
jgi:hypothetical protein